MGGAPILIIFAVLAVITAMGVFFDFLSKAAARAAKEARERAEQERAARASGQAPPPPRRQDQPAAIVELERYLRNLVEPDGQAAQQQQEQQRRQAQQRQAQEQQRQQGQQVRRAVPVARMVPQPQPGRSARRIDAGESGHLEDHHLDTNIAGRRLAAQVEGRHVVPTGGTLEHHHLRTQLSEVAGAAVTPVSRGSRGGLARLEQLPLIARAVALAEIFGPPPGLGRGQKGRRRRFTRAVDA